MKKFLSVLAAVAMAALGGVVILGAAPQAASPPAQEESKTDKLKTYTEKIDKLEKRLETAEKRIAELEKKLAEREKDSVGGLEGRLKGLLEKFGGDFDGGWDNLKKKLEDFRGQMPEMPEFDGMPDMFQDLDMDQLLDMLRSQFEGQLPEFFDGFDMDGLFERFKDQLDPQAEPKKKSGPRRRSI